MSDASELTVKYVRTIPLGNCCSDTEYTILSSRLITDEDIRALRKTSPLSNGQSCKWKISLHPTPTGLYWASVTVSCDSSD